MTVKENPFGFSDWDKFNQRGGSIYSSLITLRRLFFLVLRYPFFRTTVIMAKKKRTTVVASFQIEIQYNLLMSSAASVEIVVEN